jgi:hypothetical protein
VDAFLDVALRSARVKTAVACLRAPAADTLPADRVRGRTVRDAIAAIQSRLVGADHGQLMVAPEGGAVSLADDAAGRLTVEDAS